MKHLDLFSGIGGFALAAKWAGIETIAFCETDPFCRKVLHKHWPDVLKYMDIKDLANPDHVDLLTAGFPCQPFSQAGNKKGREDERYLWNDVYRIIKKSAPNWIIIENVYGIISMELDNIINDLERQGYSEETFVLPACAANAPHRRDRVWIIAYSNSIRSNNGINNIGERYLQKNIQQYMEKIQQEWSQFIPDTWTTFKARDWFQYNRKFSGRDDGISNRLDRIRSLGNSIVPQVVYPIMKLIFEIEKAKE